MNPDMNPDMNVVVNNQKHDIAADASVRDLIEHLGLAKAVVAIEVNRKLIPKNNHETTKLQQDDQIEVVTLVGGG